MDMLITLIGNAAVDPVFRKRFLDNPVDTVDHYRFRLTKGEFELLQAVFTNLKPQEKATLEETFAALEDNLYAKIEPCGRPCVWSLCPPPELRAEQPRTGKLTELKKRTGTK
ncbi:MAG TPA: hypothetical protein VMB18_05960 [Terriglobales bacterium]|nr:hypothetical protein [Terriglobales bacterium]